MTTRFTITLYACAFIAVTGCLSQAPSAPTQPAGSHAPLSGAALFHEKGCERCHGAQFTGVIDKGPSLLTVGKHLTKEAIAKQIHDGGMEMPSFDDSLQPDEISALVDMLSRKKKAPRGVHPVAPW